jgi:hypothetical protein
MAELTGFLLGSGCRDGGGKEEERRQDGETWKTHHGVVSSIDFAARASVTAVRLSARLLVWSSDRAGEY